MFIHFFFFANIRILPSSFQLVHQLLSHNQAAGLFPSMPTRILTRNLKALLGHGHQHQVKITTNNKEAPNLVQTRIISMERLILANRVGHLQIQTSMEPTIRMVSRTISKRDPKIASMVDMEHQIQQILVFFLGKYICIQFN